MGRRERYGRWAEGQALAHPVPTALVIGLLMGGGVTHSLVAAPTNEPLRVVGLVYWAVLGPVAFGSWSVSPGTAPARWPPAGVVQQ